jgi:high-affinity nickel-transport protein
VAVQRVILALLSKHMHARAQRALSASLALSAASGNLPIGAILCLPIPFAAGMTLMDTTDGGLMVRADNWACVNPLRKIFYNLTTTSVAVAVALVIGSI